MTSCPWCNAPRGTGEACPKCGANYAKAQQIRTQGRAQAVAAAPPPVAEAVPETPPAVAEPPAVEDPALELKFCIAAIPAMLALGVLFHVAAPFLQRTFLAMPVHELGHAAAAWFTGHWAIPTLWKCLHGEERGFVTPVVVAGLIGLLMVRAWRDENRGLLALGAVLLLLQIAGTLVIRQRTADMLIVFGGDGIGMVLATALMASFFFGKDTQLYKGALRWGFVAIGAAAFTDIFSTWWAARSDFGRIPFGEQEGGLQSDATRLVDEFGWEAGQMARRFVALGLACLAALAVVYAWGVREALQRVRSRSS